MKKMTRSHIKRHVVYGRNISYTDFPNIIRNYYKTGSVKRRFNDMLTCRPGGRGEKRNVKKHTRV